MLTAVTTQDVRSQGWCRGCPEAIGGVEFWPNDYCAVTVGATRVYRMGRLLLATT